MESPAWLGTDVVEEILRRVDGTTLARAACACTEFGRIGREDALWEDACGSFCPPDPLLRHFIPSSFGGFRKFYAHSFPFVLPRLYDDDSRDPPQNAKASPSSSDFVSIVDVQYQHKSIYSQVLWGIPDADDLHGWCCDCPFAIDLLSFSSDWEEEEEEAESRADCPAIAIDAGALPSISVSCAEREAVYAKFWREEVMENMRLRWIVMDSRSKRAVNVSSWRALGGQRQHWGLGNDFALSFGCILPPPYRNALLGKAVRCIIVMKCSICCDEGESGKLKINELSLQLRDMAGGHVNGRNSLLILEKAMRCRRTTDHNKMLECYRGYLKAQSDLAEQKIRSDGRFDTALILTGVVVFAACWYFILKIIK